jgi:hypothetical protein
MVPLSMLNVLACNAPEFSKRGTFSGRVRARCGAIDIGCKQVRQEAGCLPQQFDQGRAPRFFGSTSAVLVSRNDRHRLLDNDELMLSPPPIYLQEEAVWTVGRVDEAFRSSGHRRVRVW